MQSNREPARDNVRPSAGATANASRAKVTTLARECAKLDRAAEQAMAEEGLSGKADTE